MRLKPFKQLFRSPFKPLYDEARLPEKIRRSILFMMIGNILGGLSGTISGGSPLTGFAAALGANDFIYGVLTAVPIIGTLMQLIAAHMVRRTGKRKKYMLVFGLISRAIWLLIALVPFIVPADPTWLRIWSVIIMIFIINISGSFINVCFTPWFGDLVPIGIRGRWMSYRGRITSILNVLTGIAISWLLDSMTGFTGYTIAFLMAGVFGVADIMCFFGVQDIPVATDKKEKLFASFGTVFRDKNFRRFMIFWTCWCFACNFGGSYYTRYALGPMGLSYMQVTIAGQIASSLITVLVLPFWGRFIDRFGGKATLKIACTSVGILSLIWQISTPGSMLPMLLYNLMGAAFWCASDLTGSTLLMETSAQEQRSSYIAIFACVTSIAGTFTAVLGGGAVLQIIGDAAAANGWMMFGQPLDQYKVIFLMNTLARLLVVFLILPHVRDSKNTTLREVRLALAEDMKMHRQAAAVNKAIRKQKKLARKM